MHSQLSNMCDEGFLKCLEKYVENYSFIEWIRENTKGEIFFKKITFRTINSIYNFNRHWPVKTIS